MVDMLEFSAAFWEDLLDCQPPKVDNSCRKGDLTYAATDYLGVCPYPVRVPDLRAAKAEWIAISESRQRGQKSKSVKHYAVKNK